MQVKEMDIVHMSGMEIWHNMDQGDTRFVHI